MRLKAAILATVMLVASACGAVGPAPQQSTEADVDITGPVTVTFWHALGAPATKAFDELAAKFNATNGKGITIVGVRQDGYTQLYQKTLGAIQAGALPEAAHAYESFVADYTKADVVVDLGPYVNSKKNGLSKESLDDIYKGYLDTNTFPQFGNKLLSFPFSKSLAVMYVNDDVLREIGKPIPKTWDEFEATAKAATKKDASGKTVRYGYGINTDASYFNAQVLARGGKLMSDDNKTAAWNGKEGLAVLQMYDRGLKDGWTYLPKGFDWQNDIAAGKVAFYFSTTTSRPFLHDLEKTPYHWSVASIPQSDPSKPKTVMFGANATIFKSTPEKQLAAWLFYKWFNDAEQTAVWSVASGYMPVRKSSANAQVLKDLWAKNDPQGKQSFDVNPTAVPEPNVRGQQDIRDVILDMTTQVTTRKATPEQAIKPAGDKANQILKDNQ